MSSTATAARSCRSVDIQRRNTGAFNQERKQKLVQRLAALQAQAPGKCHSAREIAKFCGCHHAVITEALESALIKIRRGLQAAGLQLDHFRDAIETERETGLGPLEKMKLQACFAGNHLGDRGE